MFHFKRAFTKMFTVSGRASRAEYNYTILLFVVFMLIGKFVFGYRALVIILFMSIIMLYTALARRIHDLGYAVKVLSISFGLPLRMWFGMSLMISEGEPHKNQWGLPPEWEEKGITSEEQARFFENRNKKL